MIFKNLWLQIRVNNIKKTADILCFIFIQAKENMKITKENLIYRVAKLQKKDNRMLQ